MIIFFSCQFVVRSDGDYSLYLKDPDLLVDWDLIEQVRVFSCEDVNCPICLSAPIAGNKLFIHIFIFQDQSMMKLIVFLRYTKY